MSLATRMLKPLTDLYLDDKNDDHNVGIMIDILIIITMLLFADQDVETNKISLYCC